MSGDGGASGRASGSLLCLLPIAEPAKGVGAVGDAGHRGGDRWRYTAAIGWSSPQLDL